MFVLGAVNVAGDDPSAYLVSPVTIDEPQQPEAFGRVETAPGQEAQVDFGYAGRMLDPQTGLLRNAWADVQVLGFSRHQYVEFVWDQRVAPWLMLHRHAPRNDPLVTTQSRIR